MSSNEEVPSDNECIPSSKKKRARAPPMTATEKTILLQSINKYKTIIENKVTNAVWTCKKAQTWIKITEKVNSQPGVHKRSGKQFCKAWENLLKQAKIETSANKKARKKTGGGEEDDISCASQQVMAIVPAQITSEPLLNKFDSDATDLTFHNAIQQPNKSDTNGLHIDLGQTENSIHDAFCILPTPKKSKAVEHIDKSRALLCAQETLLSYEKEQHLKKWNYLKFR